MATLQKLSNREAIIELAQGIGEATAAIWAVNNAVGLMADALPEQLGSPLLLEHVRRDLLKCDTELSAAYERALMVLKDMAGDA